MLTVLAMFMPCSAIALPVRQIAVAPKTVRDDVFPRMPVPFAGVEILFVPNVDHGFIGKTQDETRAATLQALQRTFDYIDALFARKSSHE